MTDVTSQMLARYLADECDPQERAAIKRWIAADPAHRETVASLEAMWSQGLERRPTLDVDAFWTALEGRLDRTAAPVPVPALRPAPAAPTLEPLYSARRPWWRWGATAAVAAAGLFLAVVPSARRAVGRVFAQEHATTIREVATKRGQHTTEVSLGDGSRVLLGPESRLRFADDFGTGVRQVDLQGQAYFIVTHDGRRPFRVRTAGSVTEDLGTEFVVRQYPDEATARVAVASGLVALTATRRGDARQTPLVLGAGAVGRVDSTGLVVPEPEESATRYLTWTRGQLVFADAPLHDVVRELARWYDLDFRIADPRLDQQRFTYTFDDESSVEAIQAVAVLVGAQYEQKGRLVTFHSTPSPREAAR